MGMITQIIGLMLRLSVTAVRLVLAGIILSMEAFLWIVAVLIQAFAMATDAVKGICSVRGGLLRCPQGHVFETEGLTYRCTACGFVYVGSAWRCGNPECTATTTSFVNCPECGLSVRNPYRWGRP